MTQFDHLQYRVVFASLIFLNIDVDYDYFVESSITACIEYILFEFTLDKNT